MGTRFLNRLIDAAAGAGSILYTIRDNFLSADPGPVDDGRLAEPGPGTMSITDTEEKFSISGGPPVFLLMESGDTYLTEEGDRYIIDI